MVFEENIQALNTVLAVKRGYNGEPKEEETQKSEAQVVGHPKQTALLSSRKTTGSCERERVAAERDKQRQRRNLNSCAPRAGQAKEKRLKKRFS